MKRQATHKEDAGPDAAEKSDNESGDKDSEEEDEQAGKEKRNVHRRPAASFRDDCLRQECLPEGKDKLSEMLTKVMDTTEEQKCEQEQAAARAPKRAWDGRKRKAEKTPKAKAKKTLQNEEGEAEKGEPAKKTPEQTANNPPKRKQKRRRRATERPSRVTTKSV